MDWHDNLLTTPQQIAALLADTRRIAVLGIKTEARADQPAYYVPEYLASVGFEIIPVPVYHPEAREILGQPVYRRLVDVPDPIDLVDVFRRPHHIPQHLNDLLASRPRAVWFQSGIRNDDAAEILARAGIRVVQDRCLMVDHQRFGGR